MIEPATYRSAMRDGKVWVCASFSGSKETPLLGACKLTMTGAIDPESSFLAYMLLRGMTIEQAQAALKKAKAK